MTDPFLQPDCGHRLGQSRHYLAQRRPPPPLSCHQSSAQHTHHELSPLQVTAGWTRSQDESQQARQQVSSLQRWLSRGQTRLQSLSRAGCTNREVRGCNSGESDGSYCLSTVSSITKVMFVISPARSNLIMFLCRHHRGEGPGLDPAAVLHHQSSLQG